MFPEVTLRPPAWKKGALIIAGVVCATYILCIIAIKGRAIENGDTAVVVVCGAVAWMFWNRARTLAGASLGIRKYGIEIKRHAAEPLFIEWKEIERIEATTVHAHQTRGFSNTCYIGIRFVDKCPKRHSKDCEKNRLHGGCDILLADVYDMSIVKTVDLLNEKMREATGRQPIPADPPSDDFEVEPPHSFDGLPCFECKCPSCMTVQTFYLEEPGWNEYVTKGVVRCPSCKFSRLTRKDEEWEKLQQAALIWNQMHRGTLTKEAAVSKVLALNSKILGGIAFESLTWQCKSCGAENPPHFDECWKCQHEREDAPGNSSDILPIDFDE